MDKPKFDPNMPFTPAPPLTSGGKPAFNPNASFQASNSPMRADEQREQPGIPESLLRGAAQGATLGFADELAGAGEAGIDAISKSSLDDILEDYRKHRDESRANFDAAEKANPIASGIGNFAGAVAPALLTGGSSVGASAAKSLGSQMLKMGGMGAASGAISGLGASKADLTKDDYGGAALDTGLGALTGGVVGAAMPAVAAGGKYVLGKAKDIGSKAISPIVDKIGDVLGDTQTGQDVARSFDLGKKGLAVSGIGAEDRVTEDVADETKRAWEAIHNVVKGHREWKQSVIDEAEDMVKRGQLDPFQMQNLIDNEIESIEKLPYNSADKESLKKELRSIVETQVKPEKLTMSNMTDGEGKAISSITDMKGGPNGVDPDSVAGFKPKSSNTIQKFGADPETGDKYLQSTIKRVSGEIPQPPVAREYTPQELYDLTKYLGDKAYDKNSSPLLSRHIKSVSGKVSDALEGYVNPVGDVSGNNQAINQGLEALKSIANSKKTATIGADAPNSSAYNFVKNFSNNLDPTLTARKEAMLGHLNNIDPKFKDAIQNKLEDASKNFDLVKRMSQGTTIGKFQTQVTGPLLKLPAKLANYAGQGVNKIEQVADKVAGAPTRMSNFLTDKTPDQVKDLATTIGQLPLPGDQHKRLADILTTAADRDRTSRNALLFAIEQNPAYREILHGKDDKNK